MADSTAHIDAKAVPAEIDRWNWGAFLLNWIWGVGNNTFIALLTFIPFFGILIMPFVLGAKGSAWAWRNGRWDSIEHFKRVQRLWAIWGVVIWIGVIALWGSFFGGILYMLAHSDAYRLGVVRLEANSEAVNLLGPPIRTGIPMGSISILGASGSARLSFSVSGTKAAGKAFLEAVKQNGVWSIKGFKLKIDGRDEVIDLMNETRAEIEDSQRPIAASMGLFANALHASPFASSAK
ncbi:cytochrome c oxidase assembly factor Coa1 family protein [Methyloferula stellata]|uniref:cytochrome c oxidase assembly factor Coa1 family protein n=1 Tax=Methyloferula stellata TaxID=876270 RepID=UPI00037BA5CE|nr:cytochrome c oxidase assembly factor Coa1 family protein [Methyloferula stellata]